MWKQWMQLPNVLNKGEKKWFVASVSLIIASFLFLVGTYLLTHRVEIPTTGGTYTEALVGEPRLINPLYASTNDVDADLSALMYSGLLKWKPDVGYANDLAESMTINPEQTQYTIRIHERAKFSDGEPVQASDVVFTYTAIQNPVYRSPLFSALKQVKIEQVDERTVSFTLPNASPSFLSHLTIGILPENAWTDILPQNAPLASLNLQPIGSGPYQFQEFTKDKKGSIRSYTLKRNGHYGGEKPKIDRLTFKFYPDSEAAMIAVANKNVEGIGSVSYANREEIEKNHTLSTMYPRLPSSTFLFFNPQHTVLKKEIIRRAISQGIQKETIVDTILQSHARVLEGPLLEGMPGFDASFRGIAFDPSTAIDALEKAGFEKSVLGPIRKIPAPVPEKPKPSSKKKTPDIPTPIPEQKDLTFTLTMADTDELRAVATAIKTDLEKIGIGIEIKAVPLDQLFSTIIEPQSYELLLATQYAGLELDPFIFWHSTKSGKNGLNISQYQNKEIDKLLEKGHTSLNEVDRTAIYRQMQNLLVKDIPVVFLYQSTYAYAIAKKIHATPPSVVRIPSDRFSNVKDWYIKTKKVLK